MADSLSDKIGSKNSLFGKIIDWIKRMWSVRFVRFLFVGGINTLFGYLVFSGFILLHIHYALASFMSTVVGIVFNFFTTGRIVFHNKSMKLILRFFGVYGITYLINLGCLKIFDHLQISMLIAGAILMLPMALVSYTLNRLLVFKNKEPMSPAAENTDSA